MLLVVIVGLAVGQMASEFNVKYNFDRDDLRRWMKVNKPHTPLMKTEGGSVFEERLSEFVEGVMECFEIVGMTFSAVKNNETVLAKGFGLRDLENMRRVDEHTLFGVGSTTKAFTTTLLGMLKYESCI